MKHCPNCFENIKKVTELQTENKALKVEKGNLLSEFKRVCYELGELEESRDELLEAVKASIPSKQSGLLEV